jgi:uncharacterized membrane protein YgcG
MNNLYEVLEICLQELEQGADVETVLFRYPDLADELRPILVASAGARSMAVAAPPADVVRRNRAKVLQHAAQMRETKTRSSQRFWFASLRRIAVTLAMVAILFVSGTGLVGASSNTLPGDNLYPVKRTWEGLRLFFTFDGRAREVLELEHENERLHELWELLAKGRSAEVDFNGLVTSQNGNEWVVAGVRVLISSETDIRDGGIVVGSAVRVRGVTQGSDTVLAERIRLLSADAKLPDANHGQDDDNDNEDNSGPGSTEEQPEIEETEMPELENDNSGSDINENENSSDNINGSDDSGSNDNSGSDDISNNDNSSDNNDDDSNDNGNDSGGGGDDNNNDDDSGGGDNSGSGGDSDDGDSGGGGDEKEDD